MAGFWGWFLAQTCKVKAAQAQPLLLSNACFGTHTTCNAADLYEKMAQGGVGPESYCRFWWHAILAFSSVLGAKLCCPKLNVAIALASTSYTAI